MGSTRVKTPSVFGGAGFFPSTVCKSLVFLFSGLAAHSLHVRTFGCMYVCMYVCQYVCNYLRTYCRIFLCRNLFWILHSLCGTQPIHRHRRRHVSFAISICFLLLPFLASAKSCMFPASAGHVCVCVWVCVLTVHAQCTYSARTVHGRSARARNAANTTENCP